MTDPLTCEAVVDGDLIERYLTGKLPEAEVELFESHYLTCTVCQRELRLATAIREVLPEVRGAGVMSDDRTAAIGPWAGRRARVYGIAAAIAAVLVGVVVVMPDLGESVPHRSQATVEASVPAAETPIGEVQSVTEFRWVPVTAADLYRITLYDASGDLLWQADTRETHVTLADTVLLVPGALYLWQVDARVGWDRWVNSELARFTIAEP